jgi:hypothetical protein
MKTIIIPFQKYFKKEYKKTQIYIHHTVSPNKLQNRGPEGDVAHWNNQSYNLGTYCIIDSDGTVYELFNPKYWSNHLGIKKSVFANHNVIYQKLDNTSIGIEIDSLGPLVWTKKGYSSYAYPGHFNVPNDRVIDYGEKGFRGHRFYEAYTLEQIESLRLLLSSLTDDNNIPKHYNSTMWEVSKEALKGVPGIWSHTSVRSDKSDCHPQPELIAMLNVLQPKPVISLPIGKPLIFTEKNNQVINTNNFLSQAGWRQNINNGIK